MNNIIEIADLHVSLGKKEVLSQVTVGFPENKFSVLLGANGSGKSTLFRVIAGLHQKYSGTVHITGKNNHSLRFKDRASLIGFLPQFYQTVFPFTVEEIILTGRTAFSGFTPTNADRMMMDKVLHELGLEHLKKEQFTVLSGGERQMIMIARLLMQSPKIILMDEPTNHLDVYYQHHLMSKLKAYTKNKVTVIAIMHDPTLAYQYAEHFYFMHSGTVLHSATPSMPDLNRLQEVYSTDFTHIQHNNIRIVLPGHL